MLFWAAGQLLLQVALWHCFDFVLRMSDGTPIELGPMYLPGTISRSHGPRENNEARAKHRRRLPPSYIPMHCVVAVTLPRTEWSSSLASSIRT